MGVISPSMWNDDKFTELDVHAQLLWCYLLTGPETTLVPGLVVACPRSLAVALRQSDKVIQKAVEQLVGFGMIEVDERRRVIRVPNAPDYNPPSNPNVVLGWWRRWQTLPESPLKHAHIESLHRVISGRPKLFTAWNRTFGFVHRADGSAVATKLSVKQQELPLSSHNSEAVDETVTQTVSKGLGERLGEPTLPDLCVKHTDHTETETETGTETGSGGAKSERPKRATNGARQELLRRAERLWALQESLRAKVPGTGPLTSSQASLEAVVVCLEETGVSDEQAEHALRVYQANAILEPDEAAKWFNGVDNWKPKSLLKASGMPIRSGSSSGHYAVNGLARYGDGDVKL